MRKKIKAKSKGEQDQCMLAKDLAIYFAIITGCRPMEAAYVVYNKSIHDNDQLLNKRWGKIDYMATVEHYVTKTHQLYRWLLQREENFIVPLIRNLDVSVFLGWSTLYAGLDYWYNKVRKEAGVSQFKDHMGGAYTMRSIRCYHATEWVKTCTEYKVMGWENEPHNPLQHTTPRLAHLTYAEKDAGDENAARIRLLDDPETHEEAAQRFLEKGIVIE